MIPLISLFPPQMDVPRLQTAFRFSLGRRSPSGSEVPCIASSSSHWFAVSFAPGVVHVLTPSGGVALVVRVPSPVVALLAHQSEECGCECLLVGGRCGRLWTVDVEALTSRQVQAGGRKKRRRTNGNAADGSARAARRRREQRSGGAYLVALRAKEADREYPGLRIARSLGTARGLLLSGLLAPATHVRSPKAPSEFPDAAVVRGLGGEVAIAFLIMDTTTPVRVPNKMISRERPHMARELLVGLFGVDTALSGCPVVVQADARGEIFWWVAPEQPPRAGSVIPPFARRFDVGGYAPAGSPVVSILPIVPPDTASDDAPECYGILLVTLSGKCQLFTLNAYIPGDGSDLLSLGDSTTNIVSNPVCVKVTLAGPIGAAITIPGCVIHLNAATGQVFRTATFADRENASTAVTKMRRPRIVLDAMLSSSLPFANRAVALGASASTLVVLTDQGDVLGISTVALQSTSLALWQFESPAIGARSLLAQYKEDGIVESSSDISLEAMMPANYALPIQRLRGTAAIQSRLEERLAMLRFNANKAAAARAHRDGSMAGLENIGRILDLAVRIVRGREDAESKRGAKHAAGEPLSIGRQSQSSLTIQDFFHEANIIDFGGTTSDSFPSRGRDLTSPHIEGCQADCEVFIRVTIRADAAIAELLGASGGWVYTASISLDIPTACNSLHRLGFAASPLRSFAIPIGSFRRRFRPQADTSDHMGSAKDFMWDTCFPLNSQLASQHHLPIKLRFGLTFIGRANDFSIALGELRLDPISFVRRSPQLTIDVSPAGLRRGAVSLRASLRSTTRRHWPQAPCDIFCVTQQVRISREPSDRNSSVWKKLRDLLGTVDVHLETLQWGNGGRSVVLQAGPFDLVAMTFSDYSAGESTIGVEIMATKCGLLATIVDGFIPVTSGWNPMRVASLEIQMAFFVRLEPVRARIRELGRQVSTESSSVLVIALLQSCLSLCPTLLQLTGSSVHGRMDRCLLARDLIDLYVLLRNTTGKSFSS